MQRITIPAAPIVTPEIRLWAEFAGFYVALPILMAVFYGEIPFFGILAGVTVAALALLAATPGFRWRELKRPPIRSDRAVLAGFAAAAILAVLSLTLWLVPDRVFWLPRHHPAFWLFIVCIYPFVSAAPQELIFRVLFFRRYGALFRSSRVAIAVDGAVFGLAHLFYMNWVTVTVAAAGGTIIAWAYSRHRSFLLGWTMHAIGGIAIFTLGLGIFFFHRMIGTAP